MTAEDRLDALIDGGLTFGEALNGFAERQRRVARSATARSWRPHRAAIGTESWRSMIPAESSPRAPAAAMCSPGSGSNDPEASPA